MTSPVGRIAVYYTLMFGGIGVNFIYLPIYFRDLGFSYQQIGILSAVSPLVMMFAAPFWGMVADSLRDPRQILWFLLAVGSLSYGLLGMGGYFPVALLACSCIAAFYQPVLPIHDSLALRAIHRHGGDFGRLRLWGSLGFTIPAFLIPLLWGSPQMGSINWLVPALVFFGYSVLAILAALWFPHVPPVHHPSFNFEGFRLLQNPSYLILLLVIFLSRVASCSLDAYQPMYLEEAGVPIQYLALFISIGPFSEILTMFYTQRWLDRYGTRRLMAICLFALAARMAILAASDHWGLLLLTQLFHGFTFGVAYVITVLLVNQLAGDRIRSAAQTITTTFGNNLARLAGLVFSGWLAEHYGLSGLFLFSAIIATGALLLWVALFHENTETSLRGGVR